MPQAEGDEAKNEERRKALEVMYQQVAAQHDKIDDFGQKLLSLLPVITALSLSFVVGEKHVIDPTPTAVVAIGAFGVLASVGLFVHELRGIIECYMLIAIGKELELKLTIGKADDARYGPFSCKGKFLVGYVGRETAAIILYSATIAAWAYVAIVRIPTTNEILPWQPVAAVVVFGLAAVIAQACLKSYRDRVLDYVPPSRDSDLSTGGVKAAIADAGL